MSDANRAARRRVRRSGLTPASVDPGLGAEVTAEVAHLTREAMKGARGVAHIRVVNVEHQQILGVGHRVMVTYDTVPDDGIGGAFIIDQTGAALRTLARRIADLADETESGLFVAGA